MKPDIAIIYFTVCSGTGYGIIVSLISFFFYNNANLETNIKIIFFILSFFLIISGLVSSTLHLGHPKRIWRALSQWKSSWLSREGVAAILTFAPTTLFFNLWIFTNYTKLTLCFLLISSIFSLITTFCTAKIYSSLKAIPAWHNPLVPTIYILNSLVLGSIITFSIFFYFEVKIILLANFIIIFCFTALFIKLLYWISINNYSKSNISTATGLGTSKTTSFFEGPHTGKNFLMKEMINNISKYKSIFLRLCFCIFTYVTPATYILQMPSLVISKDIISLTLIIISVTAFIGMLIERYLFFIDSKHTVSLFYGEKNI
jgi:DMSO reductase anchor subunit